MPPLLTYTLFLPKNFQLPPCTWTSYAKSYPYHNKSFKNSEPATERGICREDVLAPSSVNRQMLLLAGAAGVTSITWLHLFISILNFAYLLHPFKQHTGPIYYPHSAPP